MKYDSTQYRVYQTLYRLGVFIARSSRGLYHIDRVWIPAALEVRIFFSSFFSTSQSDFILGANFKMFVISHIWLLRLDQ